jgi:hypothetical protein
MLNVTHYDMSKFTKTGHQHDQCEHICGSPTKEKVHKYRANKMQGLFDFLSIKVSFVFIFVK